METKSLFIQIEIDNNQISRDHALELLGNCPVNIFKLDGNILGVVQEQEDECTFCERCLDISNPGAVVIRKRYVDEILVSRRK